jgi:hypothetical protein
MDKALSGDLEFRIYGGAVDCTKALTSAGN